ncbi:hypothetical protein, partial [Vibrio vulnificus]|uniref:hypothetical protein n=1 Tax=Vibrio vulnificus TaxID=672 RepID=UPI001A911F98
MKNNNVGIFLHGISLSIFRCRFEINYFNWLSIHSIYRKQSLSLIFYGEFDEKILMNYVRLK